MRLLALRRRVKYAKQREFVQISLLLECGGGGGGGKGSKTHEIMQTKGREGCSPKQTMVPNIRMTKDSDTGEGMGLKKS